MTAFSMPPLPIALHADGRVPDFIHLVPMGTFSGIDGRGPFRLGDGPAVMRDSMAAGKLPVDENHATDFAAKTGAPSPARGWIIGMELRPDGIWGRVDWTPPGVKLLTELAYRGVSPVLETAPDGKLKRVLRAALTNTPDLPQLTTLHSGGAPAAHGGQGMSAENRRICQIMGIDPAKLAGQPQISAFAVANSATPAAQGGQGMGAEDRRICQIMGIDPAKLAGQPQISAFAEAPGIAALTIQEQKICQFLNLDPAKFAALKLSDPGKARDMTSGVPAWVTMPDSLSGEDKEICRRMQIDPEKLLARMKDQKERMRQHEFLKNKPKITQDMWIKG